MKFSAVNLLSLTLLFSSAEALAPDGARLGGNPFSVQGQHFRSDGPRYGDMSLQNDYYGMPSYSQGASEQYGRGGDEFGMQSFGRGGMPSYNNGGRQMMGGFNAGGRYGGRSGGMSSMGAVRGVQADQDTGIHGGNDFRRGSFRGGNSMTSRGGGEDFYGGRPSFHHAMGGMGDFQGDFGMGSFYQGGMDREMGRGRMDREMGGGRMGRRMNRGYGGNDFPFSDRPTSGFNQTPLRPNSY